MSWSPEAYLAACNFASQAHGLQTLPGAASEPYLRHVATVAAEVMAALSRRDDVARPDLAVQCALLHDTVEDTETTIEEVRATFGDAVAAGVAALTKDKTLPTKDAQMADSLARIQAQPAEVWMVKMADRITNLQTPPAFWDAAKVARYRGEAQTILDALGSACGLLSERLADKIAAYPPSESSS